MCSKKEYNNALADFRAVETWMLHFYDATEIPSDLKAKISATYRNVLTKLGNLSNHFSEATKEEILRGFLIDQ